MVKSLVDTYKMWNGVEIPCIGFGTFQTPDGEVVVQSVKSALRAGYRHIDTAAIYNNEEGVGQGIKQSGVAREEIFLTTKLWNADQGYESTLKAFEKSRKLLDVDYVDLYLIHWPRIKGHEQEWARLNRETWQAMEQLYQDGMIRAIGVSNFKPHHIESLMEMSGVLPMVNQIELHPGFLQEETVDYCKEKGIVVESWGPFSRGNFFGSGLLDDVATRYERTPAQVCLRWHLQRGYLPLPKSVTPERIVENSKVFDFRLSQEDMDYITAIDRDLGTGSDPDKTAH